MIEVSRLAPGSSTHARPRRPRPAAWESATTTVPSAAPSAASAKATAQACHQLGVQRLVLGQLLPLLVDDLGRGPFGEVRPGQLAPREGDGVAEALDLIFEPLALGREVHQPLELDVDL